jgi:hypothetical protein
VDVNKGLSEQEVAQVHWLCVPEAHALTDLPAGKVNYSNGFLAYAGPYQVWKE